VTLGSGAIYHGDADAKVRAQNAGLDSVGEGVALLGLDVLVPGAQQSLRKREKDEKKMHPS
jgi:hypothetical protein